MEATERLSPTGSGRYSTGEGERAREGTRGHRKKKGPLSGGDGEETSKRSHLETFGNFNPGKGGGGGKARLKRKGMIAGEPRILSGNRRSKHSIDQREREKSRREQEGPG